MEQPGQVEHVPLVPKALKIPQLGDWETERLQQAVALEQRLPEQDQVPWDWLIVAHHACHPQRRSTYPRHRSRARLRSDGPQVLPAPRHEAAKVAPRVAGQPLEMLRQRTKRVLNMLPKVRPKTVQEAMLQDSQRALLGWLGRA